VRSVGREASDGAPTDRTHVHAQEPGDLDDVAGDIVPILVEHLVGDVAHQKDVDAIKRKTREARQQTLPYHAYQILARGVSFTRLPVLVEPLREHLELTYSLPDVKKVADVLRHIAMGLSANKSAQPCDVLIYVHSLLSQYLQPRQVRATSPTSSLFSIRPLTCDAQPESVGAKKESAPEMSASEQARKKKEEAEMEKFLIAEPPAPSHKFRRTRREKTANMDVLAEFGLNMLLSLFRKSTEQQPNPMSTNLSMFLLLLLLTMITILAL